MNEHETQNGVGFAKKVGIVSGATLSVMALLGIINAAIMATIWKPAMAQMVAEERRARLKDEAEVILAIEAPTQRERARRLSALKERWLNREGAD